MAARHGIRRLSLGPVAIRCRASPDSRIRLRGCAACPDPSRQRSLLVTAATLLLRTGILDSGYWIDEAITVGIASHDLADIPRTLRLDGSPPLFYLLLHGWMALVGSGEAGDAGAAAAVRPARGAGLVVGGHRRPRPPRGRARRGGRGRLPVPDLLRAGDADVLAGRGAVRARVRELRARVPARPPAATCGRWGCGSCSCSTRTTGRCSSSRGWASRGCGCGDEGRVGGRDGALLAAGVALLYAPWVPSLVFQAANTAAPWAAAPDGAVPARHPGQPVRLRGLRAAGARRRRRAAAPRRGRRRCGCWR